MIKKLLLNSLQWLGWQVAKLCLEKITEKVKEKLEKEKKEEINRLNPSYTGNEVQQEHDEQISIWNDDKYLEGQSLKDFEQVFDQAKKDTLKENYKTWQQKK